MELDEAVLREWDSLSQLFAELRAFEADATEESPEVPITPENRNAPLVYRWNVALSGVKRLGDVTRLRAGLARQPWCVAARVVAVGPDEVRLVATTTVRVTLTDVTDAVHDFLAQECRGVASATVGRDMPAEEL